MPDNDEHLQRWISPPGSTIEEALAERQQTPLWLAGKLGLPIPRVEELLAGQAELTETLAARLSEIIGGSKAFWLAREMRYREHSASMGEGTSNQIGKDWLDELPVREMMEWGWVAKTSSPSERIQQCLRFFGASTFDVWKEHFAKSINTSYFRTSSTFESSFGAVAAWIRQGERESASIDTGHWNLNEFRRELLNIRGLTREKEPDRFIPKLRDMCRSHGVAVAVVRAPSACKASGVARILPRGRRMILLSFRHLSDDHFWFSFFHEAGHLILHSSDITFVDGEGVQQSTKEREANAFAEETLIPKEHREKMFALPPDAKLVMRFAKDIGIAPGIVVGQLQHYGRITHQQLNMLRKRFEWR